MKGLFPLMVAGFLFIAGCLGDQMKNRERAPVSFPPLSKAELDRLSDLKIFFGHQSVGDNILEGITGIKDVLPDLNLQIVGHPAASAFKAPLLGHAIIGKNKHPDSKFAAFLQMLDSGIGDRADVAFMKLCYVDFEAKMDVEALFKEYQATVDSVMSRHPNLILAHFTAPLSAYPTGIKSRLSRFIGRTVPEDARNRNRNKYNALIREHYGKSGRCFDIAAIEAGALNGREGCTALQEGSQCQTLCPEYTSDGYHLNPAGARRVAEELLRFLAKAQ